MSNNSPAVAAPVLHDVLLALAERCEREMPSGNLDRDIHLGLHGLTAEEAASRWMPGSIERNIPAYTSSLDAAVRLVPPDSWRETNGPRRSINIPSPVLNFWRTEITTWENRRDNIGWAATEALSICAAALKARAILAAEAR